MARQPALSLAILASLLVLVVSLWPVSGPATGNDKLDHMLTYGVLMLLWFRAVPMQTSDKLLLLMTAVVTFGGLIEFLQGLTSYRLASLADMIANSVGAGCVLLLILAWQRIRKQQ